MGVGGMRKRKRKKKKERVPLSPSPLVIVPLWNNPTYAHEPCLPLLTVPIWNNHGSPFPQNITSKNMHSIN